MNELSLGQAPQLWRCNSGRVDAGRSRHLLREWWSLLFIAYEADLYLDGEHVHLQPGCLLLVAPGVEKIYEHQGPAQHLFAHFRLHKTKQRRVRIPVHIEHLDDAVWWQNQFQELIDIWQSGDHFCAEVALWKLLLEMQRYFGAEHEQAPIHPAARSAMHILHQQLATGPSLAAVAGEVGVSKNHLNALFKKHYNETVHAALIRMRMERAYDLLTQSDVALSSVAAQVGIYDMQAFNKIIHKHFAQSPSALRVSHFNN